MHTAISTLLIHGLLVAAAAENGAGAEPSKGFDAAMVSALAIEPAAMTFPNLRQRQQLIIMAKRSDRTIDVTEEATLASADEKIARVNDRFEVVPVAPGKTEITAKLGPHVAKLPVEIALKPGAEKIDFANEIAPILSKRTCNSGACHGKSGGQNGFALSLLGFEPAFDYVSLVIDARGRRLFPAAAEKSLLLEKATGKVPHKGGKLLRPTDDDYHAIVAWINQGMPHTSESPAVAKIDVLPSSQVMSPSEAIRLRVIATYSNGATEDVTRQTLFESNNDAVAAVDRGGRVTALGLGSGPVMARYKGQVALFRASVPRTKPIADPPAFAVRNLIDEKTSKHWRDLGIAPSEQVNDSTFIRRLSVDLCGRLPDPDVAKAFAASTDPAKREQIIDKWLNSADYASYAAMKWGAILQNKRGGKPEYTDGTHAMSLWLKQAFASDMPYNQFARAILTASGTPEITPAVVWYRQVRTNEDNADNFSQLFLGTRIQCARCHHHPFEKWSQDDYWGMAAFFGRVGRKNFETHASGQPNEAIFVTRGGGVRNPKTGKMTQPKGLDAAPLDVPPGDDPRQRLADWMTSPDNKMFSRAIVNRLWGHFFGRGIVEPIDDMRVTNPPSNPELLDALAEDFVKNGYSIKHTIKLICSSSTYQVSSVPNESNAEDRGGFSRHYPKRLAAEVMLDSIDQLTGVPTSFGFPKGMRAVDLPDEQIGSYFLDIFGRPQRSSSCECERTTDANLSQALHMLNSSEIQSKLTSGEGRAAKLIADKRPDAEKVTELFLRAFARVPTADELRIALEHIAGKPDKATAFQNLIWALINTKEFQFNT